MTATVFALLLQVWEAPPPPGSSTAPTIRPAHQGLTFGLSLGVGDAVMTNTGRATGGHIGGGSNLIIGGFLTKDLVLALKADWFNAEVGNLVDYGVVGQYWIGDDFTLIGGIGLGSGSFIDTSFALIVGATWNVWKPYPQNVIGVYVDVTPTFSDPSVVIIQAGAGWQFF
jgi:hypothetical protein